MYLTHMAKPTDATIKTWAQLIRTHGAALSTVESALKEAGLPSLDWYDILLELERVGNDGIRPFELQNELLLPQYGISRLLNRIGTAGYLERLSCEEDGRGKRLIITQSGKDIRRRIWSVYSEAIEQAVGSKLRPKEIETLSRLLKRLI